MAVSQSQFESFVKYYRGVADCQLRPKADLREIARFACGELMKREGFDRFDDAFFKAKKEDAVTATASYIGALKAFLEKEAGEAAQAKANAVAFEWADAAGLLARVDAAIKAIDAECVHHTKNAEDAKAKIIADPIRNIQWRAEDLWKAAGREAACRQLAAFLNRCREERSRTEAEIREILEQQKDSEMSRVLNFSFGRSTNPIGNVQENCELAVKTYTVKLLEAVLAGWAGNNHSIGLFISCR